MKTKSPINEHSNEESPNPDVKMTEEETELFNLIVLLSPYRYDGSTVLQRFGDLEKGERVLKSLIDKGIVKYDGFDPENFNTHNEIRRGINWSFANHNRIKDLLAKEGNDEE